MRTSPPAHLYPYGLRLVALAVVSSACLLPLTGTAREHPGLFFSADEIPAFRERVQTLEWAAEAHRKLVQRVDNWPGIALPPPNSLIRDQWRPTISENSKIAADAAFLYLLDGQPRHLQLARDYLLSYAAGFEDRINFHNIDDKDGIVIYDSGTLGVFSAWTYDMLYPHLTPEERELIETRLLGGIVETIRATQDSISMQDLWAGKTEDTGKRPRDYDWGPGQWNGNMYCNTGIAAIAFTLGDEELIEHVVGNWKVYLERDMLADGMWQEEDYAYSRFCYSSMQVLAEMAHQYGYREDLYRWEVQARPLGEWDPGYVDAPLLAAEGEPRKLRTMKQFLDAQIGFQYPNLLPGNWGWQTNSASFLGHGAHVTFYELGYQRYGDPAYGWILQQMDRSRGNSYAQGLISPIIYAGNPVMEAETPDSRSTWYNHSKWIVLKSIEGREYWGSDAIYTFMPYGAVRTKSLRALSVDLFAFGKVVAPRVSKQSRLQAHDKDYYLTDDSWNAYMIDGQNLSAIREHYARSWMEFHDFNPSIKIAQACLEIEQAIRPSIWYPDIAESDPAKDRVDSRLLGLTSDYLLDVLDIRYKETQAYKRNFEWIWHAFGKLELQGIEDGEIATTQWSATWLDPQDGIGLRTTLLGSGRRGGTKVSVRHNQYDSYIRVLRGNTGESFVALHEPFRGQPAIDSLEQLGEYTDTVAVKVTDTGRFTDYLCVAFAADAAGFDTATESMRVDGKYGYIRVAGSTVTATGAISSATIAASGIDKVMLNGTQVPFSEADGRVSF